MGSDGPTDRPRRTNPPRGRGPADHPEPFVPPFPGFHFQFQRNRLLAQRAAVPPRSLLGSSSGNSITIADLLTDLLTAEADFQRGEMLDLLIRHDEARLEPPPQQEESCEEKLFPHYQQGTFVTPGIHDDQLRDVEETSPAEEPDLASLKPSLFSYGRCTLLILSML